MGALLLSGLVYWAQARMTPGNQVLTIDEAALGEMLFNERILSADSVISCAGCHKPAFAFADTTAFSTGIGGKKTRRNTPSVLNMKNRPYFFWDGRAESLAAQSLMPIQHPDEMGLPVDSALARLNRTDLYRTLFIQLYGREADRENLSRALAAFEQTLETVDSRFDDWSNGEGRLTASEERGRKLFIGDKAKCFDCHFMEDFTDDEFRNIGLFDGRTLNDSGRYRITGQMQDLGKFKTPGLRNVAVTAPYMHNGRFKTLEDVLQYYNNPDAVVPGSINRDSLLAKPLGLSEREIKDLIAFLKTLTDKRFIQALSGKS